MNSQRASYVPHLYILGCIVFASALLRFLPASALADGPSCLFHAVTHLNCPFCGMTRDFAAILHGQKPHLNPFSWMAAVVIYFVYPLLFLWALLRQRFAVFYQPAVHRAIAAALIVMLVGNNLPR